MGRCYWKDGEMFCELEIPAGTSKLNNANTNTLVSTVINRENNNNGGLKSLVVC